MKKRFSTTALILGAVLGGMAATSATAALADTAMKDGAAIHMPMHSTGIYDQSDSYRTASGFVKSGWATNFLGSY